MERTPDVIAAAHRHVSGIPFTPDDAIVVLCSTNAFRPIRDAVLGAVIARGADPVLLLIKDRGPLGMEVPASVVEVCARANVVIDLQHLNWGYSDSRNTVIRALESSGGIYRGLAAQEEDLDSFCRLGPDPLIQQRTERIAPLIDRARVIQVRSDDGTDLEVLRGHPVDRPIFRPQGQVAFSPPEDSVNGVMLYKGACRVQGPTLIKQMVYQPVRIAWEQGKITSISRDTAFGAFLDDWLRSIRNPGAYQFAHMNFGVDHRVRLHGCDNTAVHYNYGGILVGVGTNYSARFGQRTLKLRSHVELHWVGQSVWVDGLEVLREGRYTEASGIHAGEEVHA